MDGLGEEDLRHTGPADVPADLTPEFLLCTVLERTVDADGCAVSLTGPSERFELAVTDPALRAAAERSFTLWEGPGPDALTSDAPVVVRDAHEEDARWPRLAPLLRDLPVRALVALPLRVQGETVGLMSAYRCKPDPFSTADLETIQVFAGAFATVVARRFATGDGTVTLPPAKVSPAVGIVAARLDVSAAEALTALRARALVEGCTVHELAVLLLAGERTVDRSWLPDEH